MFSSKAYSDIHICATDLGYTWKSLSPLSNHVVQEHSLHTLASELAVVGDHHTCVLCVWVTVNIGVIASNASRYNVRHSSGACRHGRARANESLTLMLAIVKHTGQESRGKLCRILQFWSFLQSKPVHYTMSAHCFSFWKISSSDPYRGFAPRRRWKNSIRKTHWVITPLMKNPGAAASQAVVCSHSVQVALPAMAIAHNYIELASDEFF